MAPCVCPVYSSQEPIAVYFLARTISWMGMLKEKEVELQGTVTQLGRDWN